MSKLIRFCLFYNLSRISSFNFNGKNLTKITNVKQLLKAKDIFAFS